MPSAFGKLLKHRLGELGLSQAAFATEVGRSRGYISLVIKGDRGPPDDLEAWATVLRLTGDQRHAFLEAGYLRLTPTYIRTRYLALKSTAGE